MTVSKVANLSTTARRDADEWVIHGQKVWNSLAHVADWCFLLARTDPDASRHRGLSCLLVPMDQPGIEVRPILQLTGTSEFNEVFFDGARTAADNVVGPVDDGWRVAMGTLGFERGVGTVDQQVVFRRELAAITELAKSNGAVDDPVLRDRITRAWTGLEIMRFNALRTLTGVANGTAGPEASVAKLYWARFHRGLGELAAEVAGASGLVAGDAPYELDEWQRLFLFTRADTIYGGPPGPSAPSSPSAYSDYPRRNVDERAGVPRSAGGSNRRGDRGCRERYRFGGSAPIQEMTDEQWNRVLDVTLNGTFRCTRAAVRLFGEQGDGGVVINNASVVGWRAQAGQAHYAAAKAGVMALTRCAALDAAHLGVRINAVAPSLVMHANLAKVTSDELLAELTSREAFGRSAEPWEVANVIVFLASGYSTYLTGEVVSVSNQHP